MDVNNDSSMLSDELKPRRTPVPSSFGDVVPRPSVPDLSIIESPRRGAPKQLRAPEKQTGPSLSHLSYNDWRVKTGGSNLNGASADSRGSDVTRPGQNSPAAPAPVIATYNGHSRDRFDYRKENADIRSYERPNQPSPKVVSYLDQKQRPTSAPSARPQQVETGGGAEPSLSRSAPPVRASNQYQYQGQGHGRVGHLAPVGNPQNFAEFQNAPQSNIIKYSTQPRVPADQRLVPASNFNSQQVDLERQAENSKSHFPSSYQSCPVPVHYSNEHTRNHVQFACNAVPTSHHAGVDSACVCPSNCYRPPRKSFGECAFGSHSCCPAPSIESHSVANPMQPVPSGMVQHVTSHPQVSFDDLYKIVLAQNDQLKALQAQVERLLVSQDTKALSKTSCETKETENLPVVACNSNRRVITEEGTQTSDSEPREKDCQKMSIGVMTSFIHAVTYRGRVECVDAVHNVPEFDNMSSSGNHSKESKSTSSDDCCSSSLSPAPKSAASHRNTATCCKDCSLQENGHGEKSKRATTKKEKLKSNRSEPPPKSANGNGVCSEGCKCNNPGVSAAITAVRGCQAMLQNASKAGMTAHDYSTFNGADLPTVTEQPVSPMSSIHVDLHDYRSSSSDESGSSVSDEVTSSEEDESNPTVAQASHAKPNGWTFYNNVLGQVNRILEERDTGTHNEDGNQVMAVQTHKQTDVSVSKRVAFEAQGLNDTPQNLKEMALKYLRENHPEELVSNVTSKRAKRPHSEKLQEMAVCNMPASNMSFATFRYLERYNLLPENFNPKQYLDAAADVHGYSSNPQEPLPMLNKPSKKMSRVPTGKGKTKCNFPTVQPNRGHYPLQPMSNGKPIACIDSPRVRRTSPRRQQQLNTPTSKILDITTLRQQPKLL